MGQVADYLRLCSQAINAIGFSYVFAAIDFDLIDQLGDCPGFASLLFYQLEAAVAG